MSADGKLPARENGLVLKPDQSCMDRTARFFQR